MRTTKTTVHTVHTVTMTLEDAEPMEARGHRQFVPDEIVITIYATDSIYAARPLSAFVMGYVLKKDGTPSKQRTDRYVTVNTVSWLRALIDEACAEVTK